MSYLCLCFLTPLAFLLAALFLHSKPLRHVLGPLATLLFLGYLLTYGQGISAPERLLGASLWLLYFVKGWSLLKVPHSELQAYSRLGLLLFSYLWPGVDPRPFACREKALEERADWFAVGFPTACLGIAAALALAFFASSSPAFIVGVLGVLCILTIVHLGYSDVLSCLVSLAGFPVNRLFDRPLLSSSLRDFWSHRWNGPFVEMNRRLFQPLFRRYLSPGQTVFALFLLSGLLHELAISFTAGGGWGGPLLYFLLQGFAMAAERRWGIGGRLWTFAFLFLPLPLLFHTAFLQAFVLPLFSQLSTLPWLRSWSSLFETLLYLAGWGHFLVLVASFQVPHRLNWNQELRRLRPLNRKLLWTYGGYIACFIFLWGVLSWNLSQEFLAGDKSSLVLLAIIAAFWLSRIVIDAFYFEHSDWPEGPEFVLGHTMLTTLFVTLCSTYSGLLLWHLSGRP